MSASIQSQAGFLMAALFSCVGSTGQIFGELAMISFLKNFPAELIGGWGAGTGLAGILGAGLYSFLASRLSLSDSTIFALMLPSVLLYWLAFHYLHLQAVRGREGLQLARIEGGGIASDDSDSDGRTKATPLTLASAKAACACSGSIMFNMVAVYCLEYSIFPGLADRETLCFSKVWFATMWMAYNIGVTVSRLSVALFRIRNLWLLTAFQLLNVVGWTLEVYSGSIRGVGEAGMYRMTAWMVVVGLCGGAMYGNCMHLFNHKEDIPEELREPGINLGFIMSGIGIFAATNSFVILDVTIMRPEVLYPLGCGAAGR
eukprot:gnl/TRDRNA2_/TRDRNA2_69599_c0_seq1.p1 gnl/TRDRNA2_/TRDRNA2_69599_c0~~gnl/TRDRNA2_/TRDRNA2_69599_c0_seq1.p1  ORF type:complete len:351 (+),score=40.54 gnl/TRDRNA2_/TRDRNA2_69599_c0_seq1:107-1054(+)